MEIKDKGTNFQKNRWQTCYINQIYKKCYDLIEIPAVRGGMAYNTSVYKLPNTNSA